MIERVAAVISGREKEKVSEREKGHMFDLSGCARTHTHTHTTNVRFGADWACALHNNREASKLL